MAGDWYDTSGGGHFSIAGYEPIHGDWHDVEKGDMSLEESPWDLGDMDAIVFHYLDDEGNDAYFTIHGPWEDYESLADLIEDMLDRYGVTGG